MKQFTNAGLLWVKVLKEAEIRSGMWQRRAAVLFAPKANKLRKLRNCP